ncbi:MAG: hypothetical protein GY874_23445 [Desulfobacteraceae bacterium]|nr:hypothetical protein [Desulfobacteraceae bacterium]
MKTFFLVLFYAISVTLLGCGFDPEKPFENLTYRKTTEKSGATSYIFEGDVKPLLSLSSDGSTTNIVEINAVLKFLNLPEISRNVPDKGYVTKSRIYRGEYHWEDYPLGKLILRRTRDRKNGDLIWKVTIKHK